MKKYLYILFTFTFISCLPEGKVVKSDEKKNDSTIVKEGPKEKVAEAGTVTGTLSWNIPNKRADGSSLLLSDIAEYVVKYGEDSKKLNQELIVKNPSATTQDISGLKEGTTYYFSILTVDVSGQQSQMATIISKRF